MLPIAANMAYYATAAQVIPVLMLATLFGESRYFRPEKAEGASETIVALAAIFTLFVGELAALRTLTRGEDSQILWALTTAGVGYGLLFVFASAVRSFLIEDRDLSPERKQGLRRLTQWIYLFAALAGSLLIAPSY